MASLGPPWLQHWHKDPVFFKQHIRSHVIDDHMLCGQQTAKTSQRDIYILKLYTVNICTVYRYDTWHDTAERYITAYHSIYAQLKQKRYTLMTQHNETDPDPHQSMGRRCMSQTRRSTGSEVAVSKPVVWLSLVSHGFSLSNHGPFCGLRMNFGRHEEWQDLNVPDVLQRVIPGNHLLHTYCGSPLIAVHQDFLPALLGSSCLPRLKNDH